MSRGSDRWTLWRLKQSISKSPGIGRGTSCLNKKVMFHTLSKQRDSQNNAVIQFFTYTAGTLLLVAAIAKLISSIGSSHILALPDPIFIISFRLVLFIAGIIELAVGYTCLFHKQAVIRVGLLAVLSTNFMLYRLGLTLIGWHRPCPCLGNLTDALHIPPQTADTAMKIVLAYLLLGSYGTLFWLWREKRNTASTPVPSGSSTPSATP